MSAPLSMMALATVVPKKPHAPVTEKLRSSQQRPGFLAIYSTARTNNSSAVEAE